MWTFLHSEIAIIRVNGGRPSISWLQRYRADAYGFAVLVAVFLVEVAAAFAAGLFPVAIVLTSCFY
jgi:hypothetical protein